MGTNKLSREEIALREIGVTKVSRPAALGLVTIFLAIIFIVLLAQETLLSLRAGAAWPRVPALFSSPDVSFDRKSAESEEAPFMTRFQDRNNGILSEMNDLEKHLEQNSFLRGFLLHPGQFIFLKYLGIGNENVYPGQDGWLFYRPDVDYVTGPGFLNQKQMRNRTDARKPWESPLYPDPIPAIVDFQRQLAKRSIELLLLPIPVKPMVQPQELYSDRTWQTYSQNRSWTEFTSRLEEANVDYIDPVILFAEQQGEKVEISYLKTDTHWRPEVMELVALRTAEILNERVEFSAKKETFKRHELVISNRGDIDAMLQLGDAWNVFDTESVTIRQVVTGGEELWKPERESEVLFLGDSFSNIFSLEEMGWGESAGMVEQLSYYLQRPVDMILQNDAASYATREVLSTGLARGRDRLAGKKVVIWQFAVRELAQGNWKPLSLDLGERGVQSFFSPEPGEPRKVSATVAAITRSPRPGTVPYKDNIITLHLADVEDLESGEKLGQALSYGWGMRDNVLTDLARARIGDVVQLNLVDWYDVEAQYTSFRRSALDDEMLELELPCWGEVIQ